MAMSTPEELAERLQAYVMSGAASVSTADTEYIASCVEEAIELVENTVGDATVPDSVLDRAVIEAGSELFNRRTAPNGISQFAAADGAPVRIARDPMVAARPILAPFLPLGFA